MTDPKYFMKTNVQSYDSPLIKLKFTKQTTKPNIWGSPDTYNLDPIMKYGSQDAMGHTRIKYASEKTIMQSNFFLFIKLMITKNM